MSEHNEREAFKKWHEKKRYYSNYNADICWGAFQSAWQHQQQRIDELEVEVVKLNGGYYEPKPARNKIESLQAQLNVAVDVLEFYAKRNDAYKATEALNTINKMKGE